MSRKRKIKSDGSLRATNLELFSREIVVSENGASKTYSRDVDNLYPIRIEKIINNSATARRCANLMAKYIAGNGNKENFLVKKGLYINDIIRSSSTSISKQYGVFFKVEYALDKESLLSSLDNKPQFKPTSVEVLDYVLMAKSKEDDDKFPGKFYVLNLDEEKSIFSESSDDDTWFYPYNRNSKVILKQMYNDCRINGIKEPTIHDLIENYRGQVYYLNLTPEYIYALPLADSVYNDCDTEYRISNYNNTQTRSGFLGKTMIVKYAEALEAENENSGGADEDFNDELKDFMGSENSGNLFVVEIPQSIDEDLEKSFVVKQLKPQFDDKLFESTVKSLRQNIMGAFNNIPEPLVFAGSGALFGTSADAYTEMKIFYWEQNEYERSALEQTLRMFGFDINIMPLVDELPKKVEDPITKNVSKQK